MHSTLSWPMFPNKLQYNLLILLKKIIMIGKPISLFDKIKYVNQTNSLYTLRAPRADLGIHRPRTSSLLRTVSFQSTLCGEGSRRQGIHPVYIALKENSNPCFDVNCNCSTKFYCIFCVVFVFCLNLYKWDPRKICNHICGS